MEKKARMLRMSAKRLMEVAEKLYIQGFISYPRTETNIFPKSLALGPLVETQSNDHRWGNFAQNVLQTGRGRHLGLKSRRFRLNPHPGPQMRDWD